MLLCLESFGQSPSHINHQWSARTNQTTERFSTSTSGAPDLAAELPNEALENTPPTLIQPFPDLVIEEDEVGITLDLADYITDQENTLDELIISFEQVTDPRIYPNLQLTDDFKLNLDPYLNRNGSTQIVIKVEDEGGLVRQELESLQH